MLHFGLILSTTSLGVVVPVLKERKLTGTDFGQVMLVAASVADFATLRVTNVRDTLPGYEAWLVLRRNITTGEVKFYLSNAPIETELTTLVRISGMRWPIETSFEEGKQLLGLGDYEVRSWIGWHHHMTLCMLAHHFLVRLQQQFKKNCPPDVAPGDVSVDHCPSETKD